MTRHSVMWLSLVIVLATLVALVMLPAESVGGTGASPGSTVAASVGL